MERDKFRRIFAAFDPDDMILDLFDNGSLFETESYILHNEQNGDVSIIDKLSLDGTPRVINWYKLTHIGRALNLYGFKNEMEVRVMIISVVRELKERRSE
jgi:hypothetical protein